MGCRKGGFEPDESLADALLFTTMCIIGLPVDVHVKDGSIYSGIFHTACVDDDYAIVLKKAKMIEKGSREANAANGSLIETLIILSEDLVQVVAKGAVLSTESIPGRLDGDNTGTNSSNVTCPEYQKKEMKATKSNESTVDGENASKERPVQDILKDKQSDHRGGHESLAEKTIPEVQGSGSKSDFPETQPNAIENVYLKANSELSLNGVLCCSPPLSSIKFDDQNHERHSHEQQTLGKTTCLGTTSSGVPIASVSSGSSSAPADMVPPQSSVHNTTTKESKLNPGAKIFSPSALQHRTVTPPVMSTMAYMPDPCAVVPIATAEPEVEISPFAPRPSVPVKFVPYNNLVAGNGVLDVQYAQPTIGYMGSRTQPARGAGQYHHLQAANSYMQSNTQNVMVGRVGPLVYMHPVSQDIVQSAVGFSQVSTRPLLIPHQVRPPKNQGSEAAQALQLCMTPPLMAGIQQPFTMASVPITQASFPAIRPMQVPGSNGFLPNKFA